MYCLLDRFSGNMGFPIIVIPTILRFSFLSIMWLVVLTENKSKSAKYLVPKKTSSRLEYYNAGISQVSLHKLHVIQIAATFANIVAFNMTKKFDHITPVSATLHWLPVKFRIYLKILLFVFQGCEWCSSILYIYYCICIYPVIVYFILSLFTPFRYSICCLL